MKTPEEINIACAERLGITDRWVVIKRGLYWRPNDKGYTGDIQSAGIYTHAEAKKREYLRGDVDERVTIQQAPVPNFHGSLDTAYLLVERAKEMGWDWKSGNSSKTEFFCLFENPSSDIDGHASTPSAAICEAFLKLPQ